MPTLTFVDATDIAQWADRRDAQGTLPELVRRLVLATAPTLQKISFRAGEGINLAGWDGVAVASAGTPFVPSGVSGWEISTRRDVGTKAGEDYDSRTTDPAGLDPSRDPFIFVSARRWPQKTAWATSKISEGHWNDVRVYDADDLATWLALAPAVHAWISIQIGKHPQGISDLESFWLVWSHETNPAVTLEFLLAGRDESANKIREWLLNGSGSLAVKAESADEAVATVAAVVAQLPPDTRSLVLSRSILVREQSAWDQLTRFEQPLNLIAAPGTGFSVAQALQSGHRVIVPLGASDSEASDTIVVPRLDVETAAKALAATGLGESRGRDLAILARRSVKAFRRGLALRPEIQRPAWARAEEAQKLKGLLLAGKWCETNAKDPEVVSDLAGCSVDELRRWIARWSREADPPTRSSARVCYLTSNEDAWSLLAEFFTPEDMQRFEQHALQILGVPDPRYDLPPDDRWLAEPLGHRQEYSKHLREGVAETLAIMGARGASVTIGEWTAESYAALIVRKLFEIANRDWRVWASLTHLLKLLAEAAPDEFLSAVEQGLRNDHQPILRLFTEEGDNVFNFPPHTGLLWALEMLAWSREHLGAAALMLARLARIDPGGSTANRPAASLRQIFFPGIPHTSANANERLQVLDMLLERESEVAWDVLYDLVTSQSTTNTPRPNWREWGTQPPRVTRGELFSILKEIVRRMIATAGANGKRWEKLIGLLPNLPPEEHVEIVGGLSGLAQGDLNLDDRLAIWGALRRLLGRYRSFRGERWVLPEEKIDELDALYRAFEPDDLAARSAWLFAGNPELPEGYLFDLEKRDAVLTEERRKAVLLLQSEGGIDSVCHMVPMVQDPFALGATGGALTAFDEEENDLFERHLAATEPAWRDFALGFVVGRIRRDGADWVRRKLAETGDRFKPRQRADLLFGLACSRETWNLVESLDAETAASYWQGVRAFPRGWSDSDLEYGVRKLLQHSRPYDAVEILAHFKASPNLYADALEAILKSPNLVPRSDHFSWQLQEMFKVLQEAKDLDKERLARLEWAFLPLLEHEFGPDAVAPTALQKELARNPGFFAEIVSVVYRAEGDEEKIAPTDLERACAERGHDLLRSSGILPGVSENGTIDSSPLTKWVREVRSALAEKKRLKVGEQLIGAVLGNFPKGTDGAWPHEAVRQVIESERSEEIERGIETCLYNRRGMVTRRLMEGGEQEHELAKQFGNYASALAARYPRTAAMLRRIATSYERDATREDKSAELKKDGIWD